MRILGVPVLVACYPWQRHARATPLADLTLAVECLRRHDSGPILVTLLDKTLLHLAHNLNERDLYGVTGYESPRGHNPVWASRLISRRLGVSLVGMVEYPPNLVGLHWSPGRPERPDFLLVV